MTDMIERVARALAESQGIMWDDCCKDPFIIVDAITAIKAMREPTGEMFDAGRGQTDFAAETWSVMIDAALGDKK